MKKILMNDMFQKIMLPSNRSLVQEGLDAINEKRDKVTDQERRKAVIASTVSREQAVAFAGAREERINANFWANNYALAFFELTQLGHDEWIEIVNLGDQSMNILETTVHGQAPVQDWIQVDTVSRYNPYKLSSGVVKYPILHMITGNIDVSSDVDVRVSRAMDQFLNTAIYALIDGAIDTFPASALIADSRIVSNTLPTTNSLSFTSEGAFTFKVLKEIVDHCLLLGKTLSFIVINPTEARDIWDWQHLVSTTSSGSQDGRTMITTRVKDEILQSGNLGSMLGQEFNFVLDPIRAKKSATFFTTEPAGTLYEKTDLEKMVYYDDKEMELYGFGDNYNGVKKIKWVKDLIKAPQRLNFGKITFDT